MSRKTNDILIFSGGVARSLLRQGYHIIDIQPNERNEDKTVFYFERTKELEDYISINHGINVRR